MVDPQENCLPLRTQKKKDMRIATFSLMLAAALTLGWSCQKGNESKDIEFLYAQPWKFDLPQMRDSLDFSKMSPTERDIAVSAITRMEGATLTFQKDSIIVYRAFDGQETLGGWALSPDRTQMVIQMTKSVVNPQRVVKLEADEIILAADRAMGYIFPKVLVPASAEDMKAKPAPAPAQDTTQQ